MTRRVIAIPGCRLGFIPILRVGADGTHGIGVFPGRGGESRGIPCARMATRPEPSPCRSISPKRLRPPPAKNAPFSAGSTGPTSRPPAKRRSQRPMQAGARIYPVPPFPAQHLKSPALEADSICSRCTTRRTTRARKSCSDKVALITGGDSGIGRAVAVLFAREGADVAIAYLDEHEDAEETKRAVENEGRRCILLPGDVADPKFCKAAVANDRQGVRQARHPGQQRGVSGARQQLRGPDRRALRPDASRPTSTAISTWRRRRCRT